MTKATGQSVIHNTFVLERHYPKPPERVFSALSNSDKKQKWFAASEHHDLEQFELDFRVGGVERTRYRFNSNSPFPGVALATEGTIQDIVPNQRVVIASTMSLGEKRISTSLVTFELLPTEDGTDLILTHQGAFYEGSDGPEMREGGWRKLLDQLAAAMRDAEA